MFLSSRMSGSASKFTTGPLRESLPMIPERKPIFMPRLYLLIYHGGEVRRGFSILLVLIFSLGPLATLSAESEDASLPACCRRNGEHHCAGSMQGVAAVTVVPSGITPALESPPYCPYYPQHATVRNAPVNAIAVSSAGGFVLRVQQHKPAGLPAAPLFHPVRPLAGRGPPALNLD